MYLLIDGENIDATLGVNILKRAPRAEERPRWERVLNFNPWEGSQASDNSASESLPSEEDAAALKPNGLFFLNSSRGAAMPFVQALLAIGWTPILLKSENPDLKIVDMGIQKTIDAILRERPRTDVVLASHDADYVPHIQALLSAGHRVAIMCFREYLALQIAELEEEGLEIIDLEYDIKAFNVILSRVHPIDIEDFDPSAYI